MGKVTAADVSKIRKMTGAGMMNCKNALVESDGDFDIYYTTTESFTSTMDYTIPLENAVANFRR